MNNNSNIGYTDRFNRVITHIRVHLDEALNLESLAALAYLSPYHFHRRFRVLTGESVRQHIKRLRLEKAAERVAFTDEPMASVGRACGYQTPASFAKAFQGRFGVAPTEYKTQWRAGTGGTPDRRTLIPRVAELPDRVALFVRRIGVYDVAARDAWQTLFKCTAEQRIHVSGALQISVTYDNPVITRPEQVQYDACVLVPGTIKYTGELGLQRIAGGRYAVFTHRGPYERLWQSYRAIYGDWLLSSGATLRNGANVAEYHNDPRTTPAEQLVTEILVPIK